MSRYSVQPSDQIFVKGYGFLSFSKNMSKNISKILSGKYSHKLLDRSRQSATMHLKFLKKESFKKQQKQLVI